MEHDAGLEDLLDRAHQAVRAADFRALAQIEPLLDAAAEAFDPGRDAGLLERIRRKAERNAACLLAAQKGLKSAVRRLQDVRRAAAGLSTYDGKGKRSEALASGGVERRF